MWNSDADEGGTPLALWMRMRWEHQFPEAQAVEQLERQIADLDETLERLNGRVRRQNPPDPSSCEVRH